MILIVDANQLRLRKLTTFLSESENNKIAFTDFACMETLKGNPTINAYLSLRAPAEFSTQVIILKNTRAIIQETCNDSNSLPENLIDKQQTENFRTFYSQIQKASNGNEILKEELLKLGHDATKYIEGMKKDAQSFIDATKQFKTAFSDSDLKILRKGDIYPKDLIDRIVKDILQLTVLLITTHPDNLSLPDWPSVNKHYVFRYSICGYLLRLKWLSDGGIEQYPVEKMRNDLVDVTYAAHATYFDGLLSDDGKVNEIYIQAKHLIDNINSLRTSG